MARSRCQNGLVRLSRCVLAVLLASCAFLWSCASEQRDLKLAEHAVDVFHSRLDLEQYSVIYQAAGAKMKEATNETDFVKSLQGTHQSLGAVQNSTLRDMTFELAQGVIRLDYNTTFARGSGRERFEWQVKDNLALLYSYRIDSGP